MTTLIQQPNDNACALAAIAMALGKNSIEEAWTPEDIAKVVELKGIADLEPWLQKHALMPDQDYREIRVKEGNHEQKIVKALLWGRKALLSVHSLNVNGGYHMVFWDGYRIYDPQTGIENKQVYKYIHSVCLVRAVIFKSPLKEA